MIKYNFTKMSREQLAKIAENAIKALADKRNFDIFTFTLEVDGDESNIEIIKDCPPKKIAAEIVKECENVVRRSH